MTLIVGILCTDGVVMASDSAATFGTGTTPTIGQQEARKVLSIKDHILFSATGAVGISQLIADYLATQWDHKAYSGTKTVPAVMNSIGQGISNLVKPYFELGAAQQQLTGSASGSLCKSMVAMPINHKPALMTFDFNGAPEHATEQLPFVALGSGQAIADPFLARLKRLLWTSTQPTLAEGRLVAAWTIDHVCKTNPGGVGGLTQLATLAPKKQGEMPKVEMATSDQIEEHMQRIVSAEARLVAEVRGESDSPPPPIPKPPS